MEQKRPTPPVANVLNFDKHLINFTLQDQKKRANFKSLMSCFPCCGADQCFFFFVRGDLPLGPVAQELRDLQEKERKLDELIQICTRHIHQMCENQHTRKYPFSSVKDYHMHIFPTYPPNYYYSNIIGLPFLANLFA